MPFKAQAQKRTAEAVLEFMVEHRGIDALSLREIALRRVLSDPPRKTAHLVLFFPRGVRSPQISQQRKRVAVATLEFMVEHRGIEPLTSWLPAMRSPS